MTSQKTDSSTPEAAIAEALEGKNGPEADVLDRARNAILGLVNRAAGTAAADLQEAREVAERLADQLRAAHEQLRAAHDQINVSRRMSETIKIGPIAPRNGCSKYHRRSNKSFWVRTIVASPVLARRHKTKSTTQRDSRFCDVGKITGLKSSCWIVNVPISKRALIQRLRRALRAEGKHLRTARADKRKLFGHYYLVGRKELIENVDIEKLGRDLKVLEPWESLGD
jgi:hypothetical protein